MSLNRLNSLKIDMQKCFRCHLCKMVPLPMVQHTTFTENCPINRYYQFHGYSGSGQQFMALSLVDGRTEPSKDLADRVFSCRACGYCDVACKFVMDAERHLVNMALREHLVETGFAPKAHEEAMENLNKYGHADGKPKNQPGAWAEGLGLKVLPEEKAEVLLFAGCVQRNNPQSAGVSRKLAQLLLKAGVDVGILGDAEPCCGLPAYWRGYRETFTRMASERAALFDGLGVKNIITACGACLGMFRSKYDHYAIRPKTKALHATEFLLELIKKRRLKLPKAIETKVTYHDPCYLGRQSEVIEKWEGVEKTVFGQMIYTDPPKKITFGTQGVYDAPREILKKIPGLQFNEMYRIREYALCCGAGGGVPKEYADMARQTALHRLEEARDVGAETLVTACSHCEGHFNEAQKGSEQESIRVVDIIDLVCEAAGIEA